MVSKDHPFNLVPLGYLDLKGITFGLKGNWDHDAKTHDPVIIISREYKCRPMPSLLMAHHRIETDPDYMTPFR